MLLEMYIEIDDFCKSDPVIFQMWSTNRRGPSPKLSLGEVMTILVYYHHQSYKNFKSYYTEYVSKQLRSDFPDLVSYNRFVELIPRSFLPLCLYLNHRCSRSKHTGIYYIDSAPWPVCHPKRAHQHKVMRGFAQWGKTSVGWFFGLKYHLVTNQLGELMNFYISAGNVSDANIKVLFLLTKDLKGWLFGDKGYLLKDYKRDFLQKEGLLQIFSKCRKNMAKRSVPLEPSLWIGKRGIIESVIDITKNQCDSAHSRHRSPFNAFANLLAGLAAYTFRPKKPTTKIKLEARLLPQPNSLELAA
ncbi:MAG: IS982 family transposase [Saprospiraceae bacterium]|nr:IS982 family transposase [Saprospiraceae bacterium]